MVTTYLTPRLLSRKTGGRWDVAGAVARAGSVTARDLAATRHSGYWLVVLSGFFEPALYLFSIGIGVGKLVGDFHLANGATVGYAAFVAPAMLAASAMNGAMAEASYNFFARLKWAKLYDAMVATPLRPFEIAMGELAWALLRGALYSVVFLGMMAALDLTTVVRAIPALFGSVLVGLAFGAMGMSVSTYMKTWQDFDYLNVFTFAMFLFSGTFVPAGSYPPALEVVVALTPLYHGVELLRGFTLGALSWGMLGHALYLVALASVALWVASRRMGQLLCR
jgi:lipooligosaccharide transport system permease protein